MNYKVIVTLGMEELKDYKNPSLQDADILEIRLDLLSHSFIKEELSPILKSLNKSILFTYRNPKDSSENINTKIEFKDIEKVLNEFNSESNYIDIELDQDQSIFDNISNSVFTVIYSYHNFLGILDSSQIRNWLTKKRIQGCIYKFAVMPKSYIDLKIFLEGIKANAEQNLIIGIAMGDIGIYSRLFGDRYGSIATYCCIGKPRAPGQIEIRNFYEKRDFYKDKPVPSPDTFRF